MGVSIHHFGFIIDDSKCVSVFVFSVLCLCVFMSEVLQSWRVQFDSPISTVLLFPLSFHTEAGTILLCYI